MGKVTLNWTWHPVHILHGLGTFSGWWNSFSRFMGLKVELVSIMMFGGLILIWHLCFLSFFELDANINVMSDYIEGNNGGIWDPTFVVLI